jgi:hypothetical protein
MGKRNSGSNFKPKLWERERERERDLRHLSGDRGRERDVGWLIGHGI